MANKFSQFMKSGETIKDRESTPSSEYAERAINELVNSKSFDLQFLRLSQLVENPLNTPFEQTDIEDLKESILENGLLHNLVVIYDNDKDKYRIISGERRYHALQSMTSEERNKVIPKGVPCKVEDEHLTEEQEKLKLFAANIDTREVTVARRNEVIRLMNTIIEERRANGEKINLKKYIAEAFNVSERTAGKYVAIQQNLSEDLMKRHEDGEISVDTAEKFALLSPEAQEIVEATYSETGSAMSKDDFDELKAADDAKKAEITKLAREKEKAAAAVNRAENSAHKVEKEIEETKEAKELLQSAGASTAAADAELNKLQGSLIEKKKASKKLENTVKALDTKLEKAQNKELSLPSAEKVKASKVQKFYKGLEAMESTCLKLAKSKKYVDYDDALVKRIHGIINMLTSLESRE